MCVRHKQAGKRTISYLAAELDILFGVYDDLLLPIDSDDLSSTVGVTRMIDKSPNHEVNSKHPGSPATRVYPRTRISSFLTQAIAPPWHIFPCAMATLSVASLRPERPAY